MGVPSDHLSASVGRSSVKLTLLALYRNYFQRPRLNTQASLRRQPVLKLLRHNGGLSRLSCREFLPSTQLRQCPLRCVISAHSVHSTAWRSGCRTNVNIPSRGSIMPPCRAKEKLTTVHDAASDIASHQVGIHALKIGRRKYPARQNAFTKAGSETLNLILQPLQHVHFRSVRHVTISPSGMFAGGSA
jgi:hypothetical protein